MEAAPAFGFRSVSDRLGWWNAYFIAKLALFALGLMGFHLVENLVFVVVLGAMAAPRFRRLRPWLGVPVAIALAYYDSWLPGLSRVISQAGLVAGFSGAYLAELAGRFVSVKALVAIAAAVAGYLAAKRFVRLDVLVVIAMLVLPFVVGGPPKLSTPRMNDSRKALVVTGSIRPRVTRRKARRPRNPPTRCSRTSSRPSNHAP